MPSAKNYVKNFSGGEGKEMFEFWKGKQWKSSEDYSPDRRIDFIFIRIALMDYFKALKNFCYWTLMVNYVL